LKRSKFITSSLAIAASPLILSARLYKCYSQNGQRH